MKALLLILSSLFFISCSNMTIGFEEDSQFYNGPLIDTREDVSSEKETQTQESVIEKEKTQNAVTQEKTVIVEEKSSEVLQENSSQESETTFYYERDDE